MLREVGKRHLPTEEAFLRPVYYQLKAEQLLGKLLTRFAKTCVEIGPTFRLDQSGFLEIMSLKNVETSRRAGVPSNR